MRSDPIFIDSLQYIQYSFYPCIVDSAIVVVVYGWNPANQLSLVAYPLQGNDTS